jgi:uncharacterized protein (TIGR00255 family)
MTGFGDGRSQSERVAAAVEVRAINNRYLKITAKLPDAYAALEGEVEKTVREAISRGTVMVAVRVDRLGIDQRYLLNRKVLEDYWRQIHQVVELIPSAASPDFGSLLQLPGVITEEGHAGDEAEADWPVLRAALRQALDKLGEFRVVEGRSMEQDLRVNAQIIREQLDQVASYAPQVVRDFRDRLLERVRELVAATDASVGSSDLIREVSIYSERCDINEEITRLRSHLEQFAAFLVQDSSQGRKLEFLSQEMFREVNTIGSKANHVPIAHCVVEMKAAIEKMREILQNVE